MSGVEAARKDPNYVSTLMGVDLSTGLLPTKVYVDETTHRLLVSSTLSSFTTSGTPVVTQVASSNSSVALLAANSLRKMATFFNDSTQVLYLKVGTTASSSSYTVKMAAASYYELPAPVFTGEIDGIWAAANGNVLVTEIV